MWFTTRWRNTSIRLAVCTGDLIGRHENSANWSRRRAGWLDPVNHRLNQMYLFTQSKRVALLLYPWFKFPLVFNLFMNTRCARLCCKLCFLNAITITRSWLLVVFVLGYRFFFFNSFFFYLLLLRSVLAAQTRAHTNQWFK